jgi:hypothetical protein
MSFSSPHKAKYVRSFSFWTCHTSTSSHSSHLKYMLLARFQRLVLRNFRRSWYISTASNKGSLPKEFISDLISEADIWIRQWRLRTTAMEYQYNPTSILRQSYVPLRGHWQCKTSLFHLSFILLLCISQSNFLVLWLSLMYVGTSGTRSPFSLIYVRTSGTSLSSVIRSHFTFSCSSDCGSTLLVEACRYSLSTLQSTPLIHCSTPSNQSVEQSLCDTGDWWSAEGMVQVLYCIYSTVGLWTYRGSASRLVS